MGIELALLVYIAETLTVGGGLSFAAFVACSVLIFGYGIPLFISVLDSTETNREEAKSFMKVTKGARTACIFLILYAFLVPTRTGLYTIIAAYGVGEIATSEQAAEAGSKVAALLSKATSLVEKKLDEGLADE